MSSNKKISIILIAIFASAVLLFSFYSRPVLAYGLADNGTCYAGSHEKSKQVKIYGTHDAHKSKGNHNFYATFKCLPNGKTFLGFPVWSWQDQGKYVDTSTSGDKVRNCVENETKYGSVAFGKHGTGDHAKYNHSYQQKYVCSKDTWVKAAGFLDKTLPKPGQTGSVVGANPPGGTVPSAPGGTVPSGRTGSPAPAHKNSNLPLATFGTEKRTNNQGDKITVKVTIKDGDNDKVKGRLILTKPDGKKVTSGWSGLKNSGYTWVTGKGGWNILDKTLLNLKSWKDMPVGKYKIQIEGMDGHGKSRITPAVYEFSVVKSGAPKDTMAKYKSKLSDYALPTQY